MKKIFKGLLCAGLCGVLALGAAGCTKKTGPSEHRNTETDALRLAIGACDEKFNPLFYTSQNDGEIANMTQASLITADKNGDLAVGGYGLRLHVKPCRGSKRCFKIFG